MILNIRSDCDNSEGKVLRINAKMIHGRMFFADTEASPLECASVLHRALCLNLPEVSSVSELARGRDSRDSRMRVESVPRLWPRDGDSFRAYAFAR